ncbi:zinc finger protein on ecdysone puffs isoform X2 [Atheta coriaria]|uniref:zinc finger protein on ecdysone puffs isoform X2 n=1 Tax=Dalotia coriaria TaxID=877792 RepID=UPI0031F42EFD
MANRRFGNQGPPQRGNSGGRSFGGPASNISPWQGGAPPGAPANNQNIQSQLALALTNLIQQSTQPPSNDGPPSLLNLNTSPGFFNQDQYNNQNQPRFPGGNRGRQDFRRNEPYNNKNRMSGWRNDNNRNRGSNHFSSQKKDFNSRDNHKGQRPTPRDNSKKFNDKLSSKQEKPAAEAADNGNKQVKQQQQPQQQLAPAVKVEDAPKSEEQKEDGPKLPTKYDHIPNGLLHCCVCNKSMWDGESFQNHVGGKAHKQMIASLEESFQITVNILRENMRLTEERKVIEFERMKRSRRYQHNNQHEPESHCNMCDLKFMGKIVLHRQSEGHQRLKRFLHPKCSKCHLEFTSRMEWVDHIFLPEHLQKVKEYLDNKNTDYGEYKMSMKVDIDNDPLLEENMQNEDDNPILELSDDLNNLFNRIPVFKHDRPLAKDSLKPATGFICEMCKMFMPTKEASEEHNKSYKHYVKFVETIKAKYQRQANEKKKADEAATKQAAEANTTEVGKDEVIDVKNEPETTSSTKVDDAQKENGNDIYTEVTAESAFESKESAPVKEEDVVEIKEEESDVVEVEKPITRQTRRSAVRVNGTPPAAKKARS